MNKFDPYLILKELSSSENKVLKEVLGEIKIIIEEKTLNKLKINNSLIDLLGKLNRETIRRNKESLNKGFTIDPKNIISLAS